VVIGQQVGVVFHGFVFARALNHESAHGCSGLLCWCRLPEGSPLVEE
jgi:hypothetical protein